MATPDVSRNQGLALWLSLAGVLMAATLGLAVTRVYQVDEAQTVYMATVVARGWQAALYNSGQLHLYPLSWLARPGLDSAQLFFTFRLAFWALFWVNAALVVVAAGLRLRSQAGLKALVVVATLAPWWAYALEARHDNVLLTGLLVLWILARRLPALARERVFLMLGVVALLLHACLFKSVATWAPLCAMLLVLEPGSWGRRGRLAGYWILGALGAALATYALRAGTGMAGNLIEGPAAMAMARSVTRFAPWYTLVQFIVTAPLVAAALLGLAAHTLLAGGRRGVATAWREEPGFQEGAFFLICVLAFLINPNPFPYNLAVLSGVGLLALLALGKAWLEPGAWRGVRAAPFLVAGILVLHLLPLTRRVLQLYAATNDRQEEVMAMAEAFAAPGDTVFDSIGLVPTRRAPSFTWLINMANIQAFEQVSMTQAWGAAPPVVIVPSYRLSYLKPVDLAFISGNYVALRKDFWVLGRPWSADLQGTTWNCLKAGRYAVIPEHPGGPVLDLDGKPLGAGIYPLQAGTHALRLDPAHPCWIAWVGPKLTTVPQVLDQGAEAICPVPGAF